MKKILYASSTLILSFVFPHVSFAQSCTPYTLGGFTLGETTSLDRPQSLACDKYEGKCLLRKHTLSKNGFEYEVFLTADTFKVAEIIGINEDRTGNTEDFQYFADLMSQKYNIADSSGEYYGYVRNRKDTAFRTGALSKWQKHKVGELWENHVCWGQCPTVSFDIDGPKSTQVPGLAKGYETWSYVHSKGSRLETENAKGLYLVLARSHGQQTLTIRATCPQLLEQNNTSDKRTGEF